jgi:hypothetical protein
MSSNYKRLIIFLLISTSFILISYIWKDISIILINSNQTVGFLTIQNFNPINNTIRYIIVIGTPLIIYFFSCILIMKKKLKINKLLKKFTHTEKKKKISFKDIKYLFLGIFFLIIIQLISYNHFDVKLDYLHDGDYLTPAYNYISENKIWSSAFSSHGGSDIFYAVTAWKIFGTETIGAVRIFMVIFIFFLKITSVLFVLKFINLSNLDYEYKKIFFFLLSIVIISLSNFQFPMNYSIISYRDIYYLLFFIFLIDFIYTRSLISFFLIPFISFATPLLHVDSGIYLTSLFLLLAFYLMLLKEFKSLLILITFYVFLWLSLWFFVGQYEFLSFLKHLIYMATHVDLVHGLEYPQPFFEIGINEHGSRGTKGLILQLLTCIILTREIFFKDNRSSKDKILLIFLFFMNIIAYKNALGRSDAQHIRMSSDLSLIILSFFFLENFINFFKNKVFEFNFSKSKNWVPLTLIIILSFYYFNYANVKKLKSMSAFIIEKDDKYLDDDSKYFIEESYIYFKDERCIFNFTTDISFPYFLKKKTCNKYFSPWLISGKKLEKEYIKDLKTIQHQYILYSSPKYSTDNITTKERLKIVNKYILENYKKVYSNNGFEILEKLN